MQQIQQQINMFHTLFYVCLGLCIVFLILSVIFFFKFDIRNIFNARTGLSLRKTVQSMEEKNCPYRFTEKSGWKRIYGYAGKVRRNWKVRQPQQEIWKSPEGRYERADPAPFQTYRSFADRTEKH